MFRTIRNKRKRNAASEESKGRSPIATIRGSSPALEATDCGLDALYDLAYYLSSSESKAADLVLAVLQERGRHVAGNGMLSGDLHNLLVQMYLRRNRSLLGRVIRQVSGLRKGLGSRSKKLPLAEAREAGGVSILEKLSPEERVCLVLRERLGLPVEEIARTTGFGVERVHIVLFLSRERLHALVPEH